MTSKGPFQLKAFYDPLILTVKQWRVSFPSSQLVEDLGQDDNNYFYKSALGNFTEVSLGGWSLPNADVTD